MATPIPVNVATFKGEELLRAIGATGVLHASVRGVCLDSRRVVEGNLFVALRGDTHDSHSFVGQAIERGAAVILADRPLAEGVVGETPVVQVEDTLVALGALGAAHRRRFEQLRMVCITGSVGKTTTKEILRASLEGAGLRTLATAGNLNNRIGVPMTLLSLDDTHEAAVIEIGMNEPGEIADLALMASPDVGLVTSVAEVHTEGVGSLEGVAREKGALLAALRPEGVAIWNADDAPLARWAEGSPAETKVGFGRTEAASFRLEAHWVDDGGTRARYGFDGRQLEVSLQLLGAHAATNAAGALAVIAALAPEKLDAVAEALAELPPTAQRMQPISIGDLLVIDDTYNASPRSMNAAFETCRALAESRGAGFVAVLGDMFELGRLEQTLHEQVGRAVITAGAKGLVACGERMKHAGRAALMATMQASGANTKVVLLRDVEAAADCARELASSGDVVLVKGSRGMRMERVVTALGEPA